MTTVRVAIVDVGANTLRLLVATRDRDGRVDALSEDKRQLGLGEEIERNGGRIRAEKLEQAAEVARLHVRRARKLNADAIEILVTSPGRQAVNGDELVQALSAATGAPVTVLSAEAEGELGWLGAVTAADNLPESIGVCDVGGGSVQLVVGTLSAGPAWACSVDIGSLRLTRRTLQSDPPTARELAAATEEVARAFDGVAPPLPQIALATGGTARALRRIAGGRELSQPELHDVVGQLGTRSSKQISKEFGVDRARARTLTAGTIVLSELQRRLGMPLRVARGGIREGAAFELLAGRLSATG